MRAGAKGYLLKDTPSEELVAAIEKVHRGETVLGGTVAGRVVEELQKIPDRSVADESERPDDLSEREIEVLKLVGSGASNREISRRLYITEGTAKTTSRRSCANSACETVPRPPSTPPNAGPRDAPERSPFQSGSGHRTW